MQWKHDKTNFDRNLAVVIGIDRYSSDRIHDLSTPVSDAKALADLLEKEYDYQRENVIRLFDEAATLTGLQTLLKETLPQLKLTQGDRLIFYFAGHGIPRSSEDGPRGYLVPQDADPQNENSFLAMSEVYEALNRLECHHLLIILDCCFAGAFRWAGRRKMIPILEIVQREHYDRFIRYPAWQVLTSAAHDQEALDIAILAKDERGVVPDRKEKHSPFALALLEGLSENKADLIPDGVITAHELCVYLDQRVSELSRERQKPGIHSMRLDYDRGEYIFTRPNFQRDDLKEAPPLNEENNPYRGLKSFEERHSRFFFGRKALIEQLSERLAGSRCPLTVVLGVSGSGKSSLVKAGLLPYLREKQAQCWYILNPMRPGTSPFKELARTLLPIANSELMAQLTQVSFLDRTFAEMLDPHSEQKPTQQNRQEQLLGDRALETTKLAEYWKSAESEAKLLLVVDYFAQLKELCQPQEQKQLSSLHQAIRKTLAQLARDLQQKPQSFADLMATWSQNHPKTKLLIVIDQFEELITMGQDAREKSNSQQQTEDKKWQRFLSYLRLVLAQYRRQLHIVLTLRSDFEPQFLNSGLKGYWKNAQFRVEEMNSEELREAIEGPALKQALYFEPPTLVSKIVDQVGKMPGALPLLSFTMSELYIKLYERWTKDSATDRALRIEDYNELGGVTGALTRRATQEYNKLVEEFGEESGKVHQATMRRVMLRMVSVEGGEVARRRVPESELIYASNEENERVKLASDRLVKARLLVKGRETGEPYIEPAHDFLIRGWQELLDWKREEEADLILQRNLTQAVANWKKLSISNQEQQLSGFQIYGKLVIYWLDRKFKIIENFFDKVNPKIDNYFLKLWYGKERTEQELNQNAERHLWNSDPYLDELSKILKSDRNWLNREEEVFVEKSIERKQRNSRWRWRIAGVVMFVLSCLTIAALIGTIAALIGQRNALIAQASASRQASEANLQTDDLEALVASLRAGKILQNWLLRLFLLPNDPLRKDIKVTLQNAVYSAKEYNLLQGHEGTVWSVSYNSETQRIATVGEDKMVRLWDLRGKELDVGKNKNKLKKVAFCQNENKLATLELEETESEKGRVRFWKVDEDKLELLVEEENSDCFNSLNLNKNSPDESIKYGGKNFDSRSEDGKEARANGKQVCLFLEKQNSICHEGFYRNVFFTPDGEKLATTGDDKIFRLWDLEMNPIAEFTDSPTWFESLAFISPDGQKLAIARSNDRVYLWNLQGQPVPTLNIEGVKVNSVSVSPDGKLIAVGEDGNISWFDNRGKFLKKRLSYQVGIERIELGPDGQLATVGKDGKIHLWDEEGQPLKNWWDKGENGTEMRLWWNLQEQNLADFWWNQSTSKVVSFSLDGKFAIAEENGNIRLWNNGWQTLPTNQNEIKRIGFSPDGERLVTEGENNAILWNSQGKQLHNFELHRDQYPVKSFSFSSDGEKLALVEENGDVHLWNLKRNQSELKIKAHQGYVQSVSFSPDGKKLATGGGGGIARLWNFQGNQLAEAECVPHKSDVVGVSFSPDGQKLATLELSNTLRVWGLTKDSKCEELAEFKLHQGRFKSISFTSDGQKLITLGRDGIARLLPIDESLDELMVKGCDWVRFYLKNNPNVEESDRGLCNGIKSAKKE